MRAKSWIPGAIKTTGGRRRPTLPQEGEGAFYGPWPLGAWSSRSSPPGHPELAEGCPFKAPMVRRARHERGIGRDLAIPLIGRPQAQGVMLKSANIIAGQTLPGTFAEGRWQPCSRNRISAKDKRALRQRAATQHPHSEARNVDWAPEPRWPGTTRQGLPAIRSEPP